MTDLEWVVFDVDVTPVCMKCLVCEDSQPIAMPINLNSFMSMTEAFAEEHRKCGEKFDAPKRDFDNLTQPLMVKGIIDAPFDKVQRLINNPNPPKIMAIRREPDGSVSFDIGKKKVEEGLE